MIGGTGSRVRLVALIAGLAAAVGVMPVPAMAAGHAGALQTEWSRYTYHGKGDAFLVVTGRVTAAPGAFFATADEFTPPGAAPQTAGDVLDLDNAGRFRTYGALGNRNLCGGPVACYEAAGELVFSAEFDVNGDGRHELDIRQYIVARGAQVVIRDRFVEGWKAAHRAGSVLRRTVADLSGAGVDAGGMTAGAELGVSAPGRAGGSLAIAVPGCDVIGAGAVTLNGGPRPVLGLCPTAPIASVASKATTWQVTGALAGVGSYLTRLLVIDA